MTAGRADRAALNSFLKDAGFSTAGDLVLLEPERSETREVRSSEKAVVATISTRARDRQGDVIEPTGVRLDRFRKNPVVLYAHDYEALPVARSMWERIRHGTSSPQSAQRTQRTAEDRGNGDTFKPPSSAASAPSAVKGAAGLVELVAKPQFHLDTELSREVWALVEKGVLSAWSVGFIPEKWVPITTRSKGATTKTQRSPRGTPNGQTEEALGELGALVVKDVEPVTGFRVTEWDLLEYSCVPVPANFQALTHELKKRRITAPALVKSLAPLGFEAPDLVATPVTAKPLTAEPQMDADGRRYDVRQTSGNDLGRRTESDAVDVISVHQRSSAVAVAVRNAFDRWLVRARGGE